MGRMYTVSFEDVAVSAQQDLIQIEAKTVPAILHHATFSQNSDVGDSAAENLLIVIRRVTDSVTNDLAEVKLDPGDAAANANLAINETTELTTGAERILAENWNIALPWVWLPPPEMRVVVDVDNAVVFNLATTPADALTMSGTLTFEEVGA